MELDLFMVFKFHLLRKKGPVIPEAEVVDDSNIATDNEIEILEVNPSSNDMSIHQN